MSIIVAIITALLFLLVGAVGVCLHINEKLQESKDYNKRVYQEVMKLRREVQMNQKLKEAA
ncbi:hypothetical protein [Rubellicoccus peritrichatus]|uniref:Uncharacterized protein n=1 Tax=Rubellicoccus peritrichatus TaxID=3080537 RepID=A0AAQ3LBP7_9BACT|nr:hypothetical protein [Puniceicoccus sp. CR14]WOO43139.1 hypothetical protein RZN69_08540 [Puniceicoccus sp. CR14]